MKMVEVKTFDLEGKALAWAWREVTGRELTQTGRLLPGLARFVISNELGDVVSVPAELVGPPS